MDERRAQQIRGSPSMYEIDGRQYLISRCVGRWRSRGRPGSRPPAGYPDRSGSYTLPGKESRMSTEHATSTPVKPGVGVLTQRHHRIEPCGPPRGPPRGRVIAASATIHEESACASQSGNITASTPNSI